MDATPGRHTQGGEGPHPPGIIPDYDRSTLKGRGMPHKRGKDFTHAFNAAGVCMFVVGSLPNAEAFVESVKVITGWDVTMDDILKTGERISNIRHAFNIREGLNPKNYSIPGRIFGKPPEESGPNPGVTIDEKDVYDEYLAAMDWDIGTTKPNKKKLLELGLEDVIREI